MILSLLSLYTKSKGEFLSFPLIIVFGLENPCKA